MKRWLLLPVFLFLPTLVGQSAETAFRTDGGDEKLPWYQLQPGKFPPLGSAHYISGELIGIDHVNRSGTLRQDRLSSQTTDEYDRPLPFVMLPYGSVRYHGAFAELKDIPLGTHLHGQFYQNEKPGRDGRPEFSRVLQLEDDFSFCARQGRLSRVDAVSVNSGTITVTSVGEGAEQTDTKPKVFVITPATRVWKDQGIGSLSDLAVGQTVLVNLTHCTLRGPGRCTDIWLTPESRQVASAAQSEVHRLYHREHGLPGWVDEVDNQQGIVWVTLFSNFDTGLKKWEMPKTEPVNVAVADEHLRTYDQSNDYMGGPVLEYQETPIGPGCSGIRIKFKPSTLLEGFRPQRIVRVFAGRWRIEELPREERLYQ